MDITFESFIDACSIGEVNLILLSVKDCGFSILVWLGWIVPNSWLLELEKFIIWPGVLASIKSLFVWLITLDSLSCLIVVDGKLDDKLEKVGWESKVGGTSVGYMVLGVSKLLGINELFGESDNVDSYSIEVLDSKGLSFSEYKDVVTGIVSEVGKSEDACVIVELKGVDVSLFWSFKLLCCIAILETAPGIIAL